jgi:superfamily I DNA/RNA helicase
VTAAGDALGARAMAVAEQIAQHSGTELGLAKNLCLASGEADAATHEGRVALMTLHAAKGLEFVAVFLTGMEEGTFPREPWGDPSAGIN